MADSKEPKKETVRITLPPRGTPQGNAEGRDTVRINLPARPPSSAPLTPPPSSGPVARPPTAHAPLPPAPSAPVTPPPSAPTSIRPPSAIPPRPAPAPATATAAVPDFEIPQSPPLAPKKETARITLLPDPPKPPPSVQMKKTQPLITMPESKMETAPINLATEEPEAVVDLVPMWLCWTVLAASAVILLIQIWNYFI